MIAAYYNKQGSAHDVLKVGNISLPGLLPNEVLVKIQYAGINPGEISKRRGNPNSQMPYETVIPHSDGYGKIVNAGSEITNELIGKAVAVFGAQSYRPFGTAAEFTVVPVDNVVEVPVDVSAQQMAQMGIPATTAYKAVLSGGNLNTKTVWVNGSGAVGQCAIIFSKMQNAKVIATITKESYRSKILECGADEVVLLDDSLIESIKKYHREIDHIIEVDFAGMLNINNKLLKVGGSIATYASSSGTVALPFWQLIYDNISIHFLGSDDFTIDTKRAGMLEAIKALQAGWKGLEINAILPLTEIVKAHEYMERRDSNKRVLLQINNHL